MKNIPKLSGGPRNGPITLFRSLFRRLTGWLLPVNGRLQTITRTYVPIVLAVAATTFCLRQLQFFTNEDRPYSLLYLIPVAVFGSVRGLRGGLVAAATACVFARIFLFHFAGFRFATLGNLTEFVVCLLSTTLVGTFTGLIQVRNEELRQSELTRITFFQDVLHSVTQGRFLLLSDPCEMINLIKKNPCLTMPLETPLDSSLLRRDVQAVVCDWNPEIRIDDLITSMTEAATNTIKHGDGGYAKVYLNDEKREVQVLIVDNGSGISVGSIAKATLAAGYSTKATLGFGFTMMLATADKVAMVTSARGTQILLTVGTGPSPDASGGLVNIEDLMASFPDT